MQPDDDLPKLVPIPDEFSVLLRTSQLISNKADKSEIDQLWAEYEAKLDAYSAWVDKIDAKIDRERAAREGKQENVE